MWGEEVLGKEFNAREEGGKVSLHKKSMKKKVGV